MQSLWATGALDGKVVRVQYVPGEDNVLPDPLSRLYKFDAPGTWDHMCTL